MDHPPVAAPAPDQEHSPSPSPFPARRPAWNHPSSSPSPAPSPSNGTVDARPPGLIDANHWPALGETPKAKPADSYKPPPDSPAPPAAASSANAKDSLKHASGSGSHHARHKPSRRAADHSPREHPDRDRSSGGWDHGGRGGQRSHHNGGGRRGGAGLAHHGGPFPGRRRGGFEGFYRGPPMGMGPYMRGAPPPTFMAPPPPVSPMRAFPGPMVFHEMPSPVSPVSPMYYVGPPPPPEALRGLGFAAPMVGPPAYPYFQPPVEPEPEPEPEPDADAEDHRLKLLTQMEFYFSKGNLCTDVFLRTNMDEQGWVDISLVAGFKKMQRLTDDMQYIKDTIQSSSILEIQGDKMRMRDDWEKWVIPRGDILSTSAAMTSPDVNNLMEHLGGVGLHESASSGSTVEQNHHDGLVNGSTASNNQVPVFEDNAAHH